MYERKSQPLATKEIFRRRIWKSVLLASSLLIVCLAIGVIGYKTTIPEMDWYDSLLNASMILSGMGPVIDPSIHLSNTAKLFASFYAIFSGVAFITNIGLVMAPLAHRFLHNMHLED
jgi:hypothetical protein